jgi:copper(I)-binding protein
VGRLLSLLGLLAMVSSPAAGQRDQASPTVQIEQAWVPRPLAMASVEQGSHGGSMGHPDQTALYVTVHNHGPEPEVLLAVSSPMATTGELHQTILQDGTSVMQPQTRFEIPTGERLAMQVGGPHLMLLGLTQALRAGETIPVTLTFQHAGPIPVNVVVK